MAIAEILGGALLLVLGRKLFWLYLGIIGFINGFVAVSQDSVTNPEWQKVAVAIAFGIFFALFAILFQKVAVILAGFSGGASIVNAFFGLVLKQANYTSPSHITFWVLLLVGGIAGAVLAYKFFDWALILLSSLYGSYFILTGLNLDPSQNWTILLGLLILGILIQAGIKKKLPDRKKEIAVEAH